MKKNDLIYKQWWFWLVIVVIVIFVVSLIIYTRNNNTPVNNNPPQVNPPSEEPVVNNTPNSTITPPSPPVNPPIVTPGNNEKFGNTLTLSIKAANPQHRIGQDIKILYTIENTGNKSVSISPDVVEGVVVRNSGNRIIEYSGNNSGVKVLNETLNIDAGQKITGSFIIKSNDYDFFTNGNLANGYYDSVYSYISDVNSNIINLRFIK